MIEIIPAIDLIDGKCVRLTEGDYSRMKVYSDDPVAMAKDFEQSGVQRLHLVDLDGAKEGAVKNLRVLEKIAAGTKLHIDFGGGVKTEQELQSVLAAGAALVTIGSLAVKSPDIFREWLVKFGADTFFVGADVRNECVAVSGWMEQTEVSVIDFVSDLMSKRVHYFFCTDISKDGKLEGPAEELYRGIIARCPGIRLVASGGISSWEDIYCMEKLGCEGVIIGKAFYEGRISLKDIEKFNTGIL
jgi:phosphoribosylformimino-5-aminoimidazole carboxamide ribotide isomerase